MSLRNKVNIRIAGNEYTLVGVESEEYIQRVGLYIDKKINEIMKNNSRLSTSMASVLTAINVGDDFFKTYESEKAAKAEAKHLADELERLKEINKVLSNENAVLNSKNTNLQLELAKREAELGEVRNSLEKVRQR